MLSIETLRPRSVLCTLTALLFIGTVVPAACAQGGGGGGGGGTGGGTIYFIDSGRETNYMWSMGADGSSKTEVGKYGYFNVPSRVPHGGVRWYITILSIPNEYYPDGITRRSEVFALREDYDPAVPDNPDTRVQLTNSPTLQPLFGWFQHMHWLPKDQGISFRARRWSGVAIVEGGLYTADVLYGADGSPIGLAAQPGAPALSFPLDVNGLPVFGRHSWGLSTTQVAYLDSTVTEMWVADLTTGIRTRIYSGNVQYLDWSSDGAKIVFGSGTIRTIQPNGKGLKTVLGPRYVNNVWVSGFGHAYFSPTASHITCVGIMNHAGGVKENDVIRVTSGGTFVTNLTPNTPLVNELPVGWR